MGEYIDLGWLVVITQRSRVANLRISAAMDMGTFAAFEQAGEDTD